MRTRTDRYERFAWQFDAAHGGSSRFGDREFYLSGAIESGGPVLELACGVGRVMQPILEHGLKVYGIDASPDMLRFARSRLGRVVRTSRSTRASYTIAMQDQSTFRVPRKFPLILMPWNGYLNLSTEGERVSCLVNVMDHLMPGGHLLMDVDILTMPEYHLSSEDMWSRWVQVSPDRRVRERERLIPRPSAGMVKNEITFEIESNGKKSTRRSIEMLAALDAEEVLAEVAGAGFEIRKLNSNFRGESFKGLGAFGPRLVITAQKPAA